MANMSMTSEVQMGKHKLVLLGDQAVGKSSILNKFVYNVFDEDAHPTVGIDFISKTIECEEGRKVRMQLWDTAGQERFRSLIPNYIRGSSVAVLVFDLTCRKSFDGLTNWVQDVRKERGNDTMLVLLGNKTDLPQDRQVTSAEAEQKKEEIEATLYKEVSAKTGDGLQDVFYQVARQLPNDNMSQMIQSQFIEPKKGVALDTHKTHQNKKKKCC